MADFVLSLFLKQGVFTHRMPFLTCNPPHLSGLGTGTGNGIATPSGWAMMIIVIFFNFMKVLWMSYLRGIFVLIVSPLSVSYHFPQTLTSILTHVGKVRELASFLVSRQLELGLLAYIIILIILNSKQFTMVYFLYYYL